MKSTAFRTIIQNLKDTCSTEAITVADLIETLLENGLDHSDIVGSLSELTQVSAATNCIISENTAPLCPYCQHETTVTRGGYIEAGEWNGKQYDTEFNVTGRECTNQACGKVFYD